MNIYIWGFFFNEKINQKLIKWLSIGGQKGAEMKVSLLKTSCFIDLSLEPCKYFYLNIKQN